jgi:MOSC domain-containing protein YiiM
MQDSPDTQPLPAPKVLQVQGVQTGTARKALISGRAVLTAIHKTARQGPVPVLALGLQGDEQADLSVHGGLEKAVYAYPVEHYDFWRAQRAQAGVADIDEALPFGAMGENLTLGGLLEADLWVGDLLVFPHCTLQVEQPREPCFKFNAAMGFSTAVKAMAQSGHCGFYLSVSQPGSVQAGEHFTLQPGPRRVSIPERFNARMFKHLR